MNLLLVKGFANQFNQVASVGLNGNCETRWMSSTVSKCFSRSFINVTLQTELKESKYRQIFISNICSNSQMLKHWNLFTAIFAVYTNIASGGTFRELNTFAASDWDDGRTESCIYDPINGVWRFFDRSIVGESESLSANFPWLGIDPLIRKDFGKQEVMQQVKVLQE